MNPAIKTTDDIPATAGLVLNSRAEFRDLLIRAGLARGAAEKLSRGGWSALADETPGDDEAQWIEALSALAAKLEP
jgi:hypothetical protein